MKISDVIFLKMQVLALGGLCGIYFFIYKLFNTFKIRVFVGKFMDSFDNIILTSEVLNLIAEIDEFKGAWKQMSRIGRDRLSALKKIATIESIGSSTRIEGVKLSDREIENLLSLSDLHSFQTRDEQEVAGYAYSCEKIFDHFESLSITENSIKQMHTWFLQYSEKDDHHRGEYKKIPIRIEAYNSFGKSIGVIFETTSPMETPIKMHDLIKWIREAFKKKTLHPLIVISIFIVIFLAIHPFQDGNGRLSRLLTTWLMLRQGYYYVPYSSMESIIENNKESYYLALQKTQKSWQNGSLDLSPWLLFFLQCLQRQKLHLEIKITKENILLRKLPKLQKEILELLELHGPLAIHEMEILTNAKRNTLKKSLYYLVKAELIFMIGKGKTTKYIL